MAEFKQRVAGWMTQLANWRHRVEDGKVGQFEPLFPTAELVYNSQQGVDVHEASETGAIRLDTGAHD